MSINFETDLSISDYDGGADRSPTVEELGSLVSGGCETSLERLLVSRGLSTRLVGLDLSGIDLSRLDLSGTEWVECTFLKSDFSSRSMRDVSFLRCDLSEVSFSSAKLSNVTFDGCHISHGGFYLSELDEVRFRDVDLFRCQFVSSEMRGVELSSCRLPETSFLGASVERSSLVDCDLTDALLMGAKESFQLVRCSENEMTAPVIMMSWHHSFPLKYARYSCDLLRRRGAIALLVDFLPRQIDPTQLKEEMERQLERIHEFGQIETWSIGKQVVRTAAPESQIGRIVAMAKEIVASVDAVLIPGGSDIEPEIYGEPRSRHTFCGSDWRRTLLELSIIDQMSIAQEAGLDKRLLGICRGAQMLAVYDGHKMKQDLNGLGYEDHLVQIGEGNSIASQLANEIIGREPIWGSSCHHQGVDHEGSRGHMFHFLSEWKGVPKLWISTSGKMIGTQFHPEEYGMEADAGSSQTDRASANFFLWLMKQPLLPV